MKRDRVFALIAVTALAVVVWTAGQTQIQKVPVPGRDRIIIRPVPTLLIIPGASLKPGSRETVIIKPGPTVTRTPKPSPTPKRSPIPRPSPSPTPSCVIAIERICL